MGLDAAPFKMFGQPISPGAFLYFGSVNNLYPIIMSYYKLSYFGNDNQADQIIVNPGYKVKTYNSNGYHTYIDEYDNTDGSNSEIIDIPNNQVSSVKLFYGSTELSGSLSTSSITLYNPVSGSTAPTTGTGKIVPYTLKGTSFPAFCPVYMTGKEGSYPIFHTIYKFVDYGMWDCDDYYLVAPHFTIIVWKDNDHTGTSHRYENSTNDWKIFLTPGSVDDTGSSCRLYYYGTEIWNS